MISRDGVHAELLALCGAARDGDLSVEQFQRLESLLQESTEARQIYVQFVQLDSHFARQNHVALQMLVDDTSAELLAGAIDAASSNVANNEKSIVVPSSSVFDPARDGHPGVLSSLQIFLSRPVPLAVCASLLSVIAVLSVQRLFRPEAVQLPVAIVSSAGRAQEARSHVVATLVSANNCHWDKSRSTANLERGGTLHPGQSLHLLEGVAEVNSVLPSGSIGKFRLEGPLAMTLADNGMPNLLFGKLSGEFSYRQDSFTLGTALGRIVVSGDASLGVKAAANEVELHLFRGTAQLDVWSTGFEDVRGQLLTAEPGTSLRARVAPDGKISVDYGKASENGFVTPASLAASQLLISDEYVKTILAAKPVAYWRFEEEVDGKVRNEISDRFHLRMGGAAVGLRSSQGTRSAEFGITAGPGYMMSDDVFDGVVNKDYSLELWAKPTCIHHGAMFSLIDWSPSRSPRGQHRLHLELCGPRAGDYKQLAGEWESYPGRICFINRTTESFSSSPYAVRKWQHLVATRNQTVMRLYADGRLIATDENAEDLGRGIRVLMGQLYPPSKFVRDEVTARLFVGELDEIALYDRPLSEDEVQRHLQLARPDLRNVSPDDQQDIEGSY